ncbi:MAG: hypothetical protein ABIH71_05710 [Candidatus Omnitrophota bacterium]|nr:hypothetical protein [Candidatus Omnitrophota bacterium]
MLEVKDLTFTHDIEKEHRKKLLCKILYSPENIIDFTFSTGSFMLATPELTQKQNFEKFNLGKIKSSLSRKKLYEDR